MKFNIKKDIIQGAFQKVSTSKVISGYIPIPILNGILLEVTLDEIKITASNSHDTIQHCLDVDGENIQVFETGTIVLPKEIIEVIKKLNNVIEFTLNGFELMIVSGKKDFSLNCLDPEEYPKFPEFDLSNPTLTVSCEYFQKLINKTAFAASDSETRPILQGVLIEVLNGVCNVICTDSHRLAKVELSTTSTKDIRITVPAKSLGNVIKLFDLKHDVDVFVENQQFVLLKNGPTMFLSRLLDGNFPDVSRLVPNEHKALMTMNREAFIDAADSLKEIIKASDGNSQGVIKLHVNGIATFSSNQTQRGRGKIQVPYESLEGEDDFTITFSCKYMLDALKAIEDETVSFYFQDSMRPFILKPTEQSSIEELQLILPVRTI